MSKDDFNRLSRIAQEAEQQVAARKEDKTSKLEPLTTEDQTSKISAAEVMISEPLIDEHHTSENIIPEEQSEEEPTYKDGKLDLQNLPGTKVIKLKHLRSAVEDANPRFTLWSEYVSSMMLYFKRTIPDFSMSKMAALIIENALDEKYPELSKKIRDEIKKDHLRGNE